MAKVWANGLVILIATGVSLFLVVQMALKVPFAGSVALWFFGVVLYLFFATALGIFLGTISRSMAQFALLIILVVLVLQLLSGGATPVESQPQWLQYLTFFLPSRHFVSFSQVIIYRGGGISAVWPQFSDGRRDRSWILCVQPGALPQINRGDKVGSGCKSCFDPSGTGTISCRLACRTFASTSRYQKSGKNSCCSKCSNRCCYCGFVSDLFSFGNICPSSQTNQRIRQLGQPNMGIWA